MLDRGINNVLGGPKREFIPSLRMVRNLSCGCLAHFRNFLFRFLRPQSTAAPFNFLYTTGWLYTFHSEDESWAGWLNHVSATSIIHLQIQYMPVYKNIKIPSPSHAYYYALYHSAVESLDLIVQKVRIIFVEQHEFFPHTTAPSVPCYSLRIGFLLLFTDACTF